MELKGGIKNTISINDPVDIEVIKSDCIVGRTQTIKLKSEYSSTKLNLSKNTYDYLGQAMFPEGLIPDDIHKRVALFNRLLEEMDCVIDKNDQDWQIDKAEYDEDEDTVFYTNKAVE